jgi:cytochrome c peroxidase
MRALRNTPIAAVLTAAGALVALAACAGAAPQPSATPLSIAPTLTAAATAAAQPGAALRRIAPPRADRVYASRRPDAQTPAGLTPWDWRLPAGVPKPVVPDDNPMSVEGVALGRHLFYDMRLSGNGTQSCATCHAQSLSFTDGRRTSTGSTGDALARNAQPIINVAYNSTLTWGNPLLEKLEQQIQIPMFAEFPVELGITGREEVVLQRFRDDVTYQALFRAAFPGDPDPVTYANIVKALASFSRALVSFGSPYDRLVYGGDDSALSEAAKRGMALFLSERLECHHCHTGFNFTQSTQHEGTTFVERPFFNTGLYSLDANGAYPANNQGLAELTNDANDMGKFRPPTLRNVALTGPYMHDGSVETLDEVIAIYGRGGRLIESGPLAGDGRLNPHKSGLVPGFQLDDQERADLLAFLQSLTDTSILSDERFSDPFSNAAQETTGSGK